MTFSRIQTRQIIFAAIIMGVASVVCHVLDVLTWQHARTLSHAFDLSALALFWVSYMLLWALLILGPFRPRTEFSMQGECGQLARNFFLALGGLLLLHLWLLLAVAFAFS